MTTIKDTWESVRDAVLARVENPFLGAFVVSWLAFNWRYVYVTFFVSVNELPHVGDTKDRFPDKLTYMREAIPVDLWNLAWWPLICAALVPLGSKVAGETSALAIDWISQRAKWVRSKVFRTEFITTTEAEEIRKQQRAHLDEISKVQTERDQARTRVAELSAKRDELEYELAGARDGAKNLQAQLQEEKAARAALDSDVARLQAELSEKAAKVSELLEENVQSARELAAKKDHSASVHAPRPDPKEYERLFPGEWRKSWFNDTGGQTDGWEQARVSGRVYQVLHTTHGTRTNWRLNGLRDLGRSVRFNQKDPTGRFMTRVVVVKKVSPTLYEGQETHLDQDGKEHTTQVRYERLDVHDPQGQVV